MELFAVQQQNLIGKQTRGLLHILAPYQVICQKSQNTPHNIWENSLSNQFSWNKHVFPLQEPVFPL